MQFSRPKVFIPLVAVALVAVLTAAACSGGGSTSTANPSSGSPPSADLANVQRQASVPVIGNNQQTGIFVDGSGTITVTPDISTLSLGVQAQATTVAQARDQAAAAMDAVAKSLKDNGVADKDIKTTNFSIQPIYTAKPRIPPAFPGQTDQVITGYMVSNSVTAKIRDLAKVGKVIDDATKAGGDAIRFNGINFSVENPKPIETQARDLAFQDAVAKAQQAAKATGVTLGKPISISVQGGSPVRFAPAPLAGRADVAGGFVATPIDAGTLDVTVSVSITFAIQ
ncbi:MAG: SIMPL domain-containing protein [Chloroflexi bacterium]|nr:SIMPL domain-containing protein [Chloroflexota bacterium]